MEKKATVNGLAGIIARRWSPRAFEPRSLSVAQLERILQAARWAPSAYNEQPWRFIVALRSEEERFAALLDCLVPQNQVWARQAGALLLGCYGRIFTQNGKENAWAQHDLGIAVGQMMLQTVEEGLFAHPMAGFSVEKARERYGIPEGFSPLVAVALGYPGAPEELPEELKAWELAPRERKSLGDLVFAESWGASWEND